MEKTALVTASTRGIGKAIGISLLQKGYYVFFNYAHFDERASSLKKELANFDGRFAIVKADLSEYQGINDLYTEIFKVNKSLDAIILNTGVTCKIPFSEITIQDWEGVLKANLSVPFFLLQHFDPMLKENGRVIFIGALMGLVPHAISIPYAVSKSAMTMLAKSMVKYYKHKSITVNVVAPGFIETEWHLNKNQEHIERIRNKIALRRFGYSEEVASTCIHIIENQYINGTIIQVDGGYDME